MSAFVSARRRLRVPALVTAIVSLLGGPVAADQTGQTVAVRLGDIVTVDVAGVTRTLVLDQDICTAEVAGSAIRITGTRRGDTVVLAWIGAETASFLVHVDAPAPSPASRGLTPQEIDALGHGSLGTLAHVGSSSAGDRSYSFLTPFTWTQGTRERRFSVNGQVQSALSPGAEVSNLDTVSAEWRTPQATVDLADFALALDGGDGRVAPARADVIVGLRGGQVVLPRGRTTVALFAGATAPWFAGSRELAGMSFRRTAENDRVLLFGTTGWLRAPELTSDAVTGVSTSVFQTAGVRARLDARTLVEGALGASTSGVFASGSGSWQGERVSALVDARRSSRRFALNEIQLVFAATDALRADLGWKIAPRLGVAASYQQSAIEPTPLFPAHVQSRNLALNGRLGVTKQQTLFAAYTLDTSRGGLGPGADRSGRRVDAGLSSQFGSRLANTAQVSFGALSDPLQLATRSDMSLRDDLTLSFRGGALNIALSHDRLDASLVSRLNSQIALLAPALQPVFQNDPVAFVESPLMPADLRLLLQSLQPVATQLNVSAQFALGSRVSMSPTYTFSHNAQSPVIASDVQSFGYGLTWRLTRRIDLQSTLSQAMVFDTRRAGFSRTTIASAGLRYSFTGVPQWISPATRAGSISGRVFRDTNMDGRWGGADMPLPGVTVTLSTGRSATTDAKGRFEFDGLEPGEYRVALPLQQFQFAVRVTTDVEHVVRLYEDRHADVEFGIVDFSRVLGTVFNDYALSGVREADAPGIADVRVRIAGGDSVRDITTGSGGDFEVDDLPPGTYTVSIDPATVPPAYVAAALARPEITVRPSTTTVVDVPVRATRSMAGRVLFRGAGEGAAANGSGLIPLKGVQVVVEGRRAVTDDEGRFLVRDLPAGELQVRLVPARTLPPGLQAPAGVVRLPKEPLQIDNAVITIENPRLVDYLVPAATAVGSSPRP